MLEERARVLVQLDGVLNHMAEPTRGALSASREPFVRLTFPTANVTLKRVMSAPGH